MESIVYPAVVRERYPFEIKVWNDQTANFAGSQSFIDELSPSLVFLPNKKKDKHFVYGSLVFYCVTASQKAGSASVEEPGFSCFVHLSGSPLSGERWVHHKHQRKWYDRLRSWVGVEFRRRRNLFRLHVPATGKVYKCCTFGNLALPLRSRYRGEADKYILVYLPLDGGRWLLFVK